MKAKTPWAERWTTRGRRTKILADEERFRLVAGPYEPPLVKRGFLVDEVRGKVRFAKFSNALIPWPKFKRQGKSGSGGFVLCGDLVRALENESNPTICHYWGVCLVTVSNWRRALELKGRTPGAQRMTDLGVELARRPESRKKISEAARGRKLPPRLKARFHGAMHRGWRERFKARRAAYQQTGRFPEATKADPWIPEEEALLSQLPTRELARVLGRTPKSIMTRRHALGLAAKTVQPPWPEAEIKLLGTGPDHVIAHRLGRPREAVTGKRMRLGIPAANEHLWTPEQEALLGQVSDAEAAHQLGKTLKAVYNRRLKLGIPVFSVKDRP
jgi:transposase-like protein